MKTTVELKTELNISQRILYSLKDIARLEAIVKDHQKILELHPEPLHYEANRRVIQVELLNDATSFDQRIYSICDYKDEHFLSGKSYSVEQLK